MFFYNSSTVCRNFNLSHQNQPAMKISSYFFLITFLFASQAIFSQASSSQKSLNDSLAARKNHFNSTAPEHKKLVYEDGIKAVEESGVLESAINVGDIAPDFKLSNAEGKTVSLYEELKKGPVVLMWYRGGWCPYCNITMHYMQEYVGEFRERGAELVALTPEKPDDALSMTEKHDLQFEVLSDLHNVVAHKYGVVFTLTPEVHKIYEESFKLSEYNENEKGELPLAVTYVIDTDGKVTYAFLHPDYRERADINDILKALDDLR